MQVIREVLHCKPGKVRQMVAKFRAISHALTEMGHERCGYSPWLARAHRGRSQYAGRPTHPTMRRAKTSITNAT
jgi:hypothetical protein